MTTNQFIMPAAPDQKGIQRESTALLDQSKEFRIESEDHYIASWPLVQRHDQAIMRISEIFDPFVSGLHNLHKSAVALRDSFLKPVVNSKQRLLDARVAYKQEKDRLQKIEDDKRAEALRKLQAKDLEKLAKKEEKSGNSEAAEVLREEAKNVPLPMMPRTIALPAQQGSVMRERYLFEITDPDKVQREYCSPDPKIIRKIVDALGDKAPIQGIRIWKETKEHSRSTQ